MIIVLSSRPQSLSTFNKQSKDNGGFRVPGFVTTKGAALRRSSNLEQLREDAITPTVEFKVEYQDGRERSESGHSV